MVKGFMVVVFTTAKAAIVLFLSIQKILARELVFLLTSVGVGRQAWDKAWVLSRCQRYVLVTAKEMCVRMGRMIE